MKKLNNKEWLKLTKELKEKRKKMKITQKRLSEDTGYSVSTISLFENGKLFNTDILLTYLKYFKCVKIIEEVLSIGKEK